MTVTEQGVLEKLVVEPTALRTQDDKDKMRFLFHESLKHLKEERKYLRHLRPYEAFGILMDALENPQSKWNTIAQDMLVPSEWVSAAVRREGIMLEVVFDPESTMFGERGAKIIPSDFLEHAGETHLFHIGNISSDRFTDLRKFPDQLVRLMYGRSFSELPLVMREGYQRSQICLPQDGNCWWPLGRGNYNLGYRVNSFGDQKSYHRGSRGCREK